MSKVGLLVVVINPILKLFLRFHFIKRFVELNVSAAFHSQFMTEAQKMLNHDIDRLNFSMAQIPFYVFNQFQED